MIRFRVACGLAAFVCMAAHAQNCSGGLGGGMDATGNQCNAAGNDVDAAPPALARPAPSIATQTRAKVASARSQSTATTAFRAIPASGGQPENRFSGTTKPPVEPLRTAKITDTQEVRCSGGTQGGMDATGNECNSADSEGSVLVAHVHGR
jgi:hypothetical protein